MATQRVCAEEGPGILSPVIDRDGDYSPGWLVNGTEAYVYTSLYPKMISLCTFYDIPLYNNPLK